MQIWCVSMLQRCLTLWAYLMICVVLGLVGGCKGKHKISLVSHIIEENDMTVIHSHSDTFQRHMPGIKASVLLVVRLDNVRRYCSGFVTDVVKKVIQTDDGSEEEVNRFLKILTNHHCFAIQDEDSGLAKDKLEDNVCAKTDIYINAVQGSENEIYKGHCVVGNKEENEKDFLETNYYADIAFFWAKAADGNIFPNSIEPIAIEQGAVAGQEAYIVHYPLGTDYVHTIPELGGLRLPAAIITENSCSIIGDFNENQWEENPVLAVSYKHTCDLTKGSSGSPLLAKGTHKLLGLNWGGVKMTTKDNQVDLSNAAVKSSYVAKFLNDQVNFDQQVKQLISRHQSASATAARGTGEGGATNISQGNQDADSQGCAALAATGSDSSSSLQVLFFLLLLLPFFVCFWEVRSKKKCSMYP
ncbi:MAG: trypsin-like peptidase domain-containing protein [Proteobacteria bacterium]|nr:trypsin-like peptidase domain-containing protein [Pseudomonadota bacterium]